MLPTARRLRAHLIRGGLGLIVFVSLVAGVVLISDALNAATAPRDFKSARAATDPDTDSTVAIVPTASSSAMTERAQAQLEWLRMDEPLDETPPLTSDRAFPSETIFAPIASVDDLALNAAIEHAAADWLPLESEVTQLARANSRGSGGMAGGGFVGGGFSGGGYGGSALSDDAVSDGANDAAFVSGGEGSSDVASLAAIRAGDSAAAMNARRDDPIAARATGSSDANASLRTSGPRRHDGDANDRGKGNRGSNGGGSHPPRGSGDGPTPTTSVPEPSSLLLMGLGLVSLARLHRRATR